MTGNERYDVTVVAWAVNGGRSRSRKPTTGHRSTDYRNASSMTARPT
jgi:hypothetical protein